MAPPIEGDSLIFVTRRPLKEATRPSRPVILLQARSGTGYGTLTGIPDFTESSQHRHRFFTLPSLHGCATHR